MQETLEFAVIRARATFDLVQPDHNFDVIPGVSHTENPMPKEPKTKTTETYNLASRRAFLRLPISERQKILAAQAEKMITHYEADPEWLELQNTEFVEYSH